MYINKLEARAFDEQKEEQERAQGDMY